MINVLRKDSIMNVIKQSITNAIMFGGVPACMIAMILFRDPSSDQPTHDMPGGANRFVNRSRTISEPLPVTERGNRLVGRRVRTKIV